MSDETLHSAARRVVRDFNIVMNHGGLISRDFEHSMDVLNKQVLVETARLARSVGNVITPPVGPAVAEHYTRDAAIDTLRNILQCDEAEARRVFEEHTVTTDA